MDRMLREILSQPITRGCVLKPLIALKKVNLKNVETGMYWYTDDTVSVDLYPGKSLKSVVLFVKDDMIYGDSFVQRYMLGLNVTSFFEEIQVRQPYLSFYYPKVGDLQTVQLSLEKINIACKRMNKLKWSEEVYLAEPSSEQKLYWVDMFDGGQGVMSNLSGAYFRPMIFYKVK